MVTFVYDPAESVDHGISYVMLTVHVWEFPSLSVTVSKHVMGGSAQTGPATRPNRRPTTAPKSTIRIAHPTGPLTTRGQRRATLATNQNARDVDVSVSPRSTARTGANAPARTPTTFPS